MTEINRILRHFFAPLVTWLVARGYLPDYMKGDVIELFVLAAGFAIPYAISRYRDKPR